MSRTTPDPLMTPGEVAALFRVDPKTVTRWAQRGRLRSIRTPGGHARFFAEDVRALLAKPASGDTKVCTCSPNPVPGQLPDPWCPVHPNPPAGGSQHPSADVIAANNRGGR